MRKILKELPVLQHKRRRVWMVCSAAILSFSAGSLTTALSLQVGHVRADGDRVFELNVYHAVPGKVPKLEARFRDATKLFAKHGLEVVAYWVPNGDPAWDNTFLYVVAAPSRAEMERKWDAFHADPEFQKYRQSESAEKLIEKVDSTYMRPTDFSALR